MLILSRKENESIRIEPAVGVDPSLTLAEVFQHGPIVVKLARISGRRVRLAIDVPAWLKVCRDAAPAPDKRASQTDGVCGASDPRPASAASEGGAP